MYRMSVNGVDGMGQHSQRVNLTSYLLLTGITLAAESNYSWKIISIYNLVYLEIQPDISIHETFQYFQSPSTIVIDNMLSIWLNFTH